MINKSEMKNDFINDVLIVSINTSLETVSNPHKNLLVYKLNDEILSELTIYTSKKDTEKEPAIIIKSTPNNLLGLSILHLIYTTMNIPSLKEKLQIPNSFQNNEVSEIIYLLLSGIDVFELNNNNTNEKRTN